MLTVKNLTKIFNGHTVIHKLNFTLAPNTCTALIGANGAGKTTTLRLLTGLIAPSSGKIIYQTKGKSDFRRFIGYLPQYPKFYDWMTGEQFLTYCGQLYGFSKHIVKQRTDELLQTVNLIEARHKRIRTYSGGMRQRLGIAQALIHKPKILLLDEPAASLDPIGRREVLTLMEHLKETMKMLFSTHILNDAYVISDRLMMLKNWEVVEHDTVDSYKQRYTTKKLEVQFGTLPYDVKDKLLATETLANLQINEHTVELFVNDVNEGREQLFHLIATEKWDVERFAFAKLSFEEMFLKAVE